jgi:hypothetical protein
MRQLCPGTCGAVVHACSSREKESERERERALSTERRNEREIEGKARPLLRSDGAGGERRKRRESLSVTIRNETLERGINVNTV